METKSRYEVIAELEEKKAKLINAQAIVGLTENSFRRSVEKATDELDEFLEQKDIQSKNIADQLESIEKSLARFDTQKK